MECTKQINRAINELANPRTPRNRKGSAAAAAQQAISEAERHIETMEQSAAAMSGSERNSNMSKARRMKSDLATLQREVIKAVRIPSKGQSDAGGWLHRITCD